MKMVLTYTSAAQQQCNLSPGNISSNLAALLNHR
jgi:hypothetical protein